MTETYQDCGRDRPVIAAAARPFLPCTPPDGAAEYDAQACGGGSGEREVVIDTRGGFGSIDVLTQGEAARGDD